eukprot:COSAG06_NODE_11722_length_1472_cov_18.646722_3_plen_82_part_00
MHRTTRPQRQQWCHSTQCHALAGAGHWQWAACEAGSAMQLGRPATGLHGTQQRAWRLCILYISGKWYIVSLDRASALVLGY